MSDPLSPQSIIDAMMHGDAFSQWLGIERVAEGSGFCILRMHVRPEMQNGFGIAHGAITYALADSALAFASNSRGRQAVSIETRITHLEKVTVGATLTATAQEVHLGNRIARYEVRINNAQDALVAIFHGTVYRSSKYWESSI